MALGLGFGVREAGHLPPFPVPRSFVAMHSPVAVAPVARANLWKFYALSDDYASVFAGSGESRMEDRGLRIEDGELRIERGASSILYPRSCILYLRSSV